MKPHVLSAALAVLALTAITGCGGSGDGKPTATAEPSNTAPPMGKNSVVGVVGSNPPTKAVGTPETARVVGLGYEFKLLGTAKPSVVTTGEGPRQAARGQQILLVRYDAFGHLGEQSDSGGGTPTTTNSVALVVDGTRTVLDSEALSTGASRTVAMSVASGARDVALEVDTGGLVQSLSLVTGRRSGDDPVLLYRTDVSGEDEPDGASVTTDITKRLSFPFALISSNGQQDTFPDGKYPTIVNVEKANLTYTLTQPNYELKYPSSPDKAFLTLDTEVTGGNSWRTALPTKDFTLTTDEGEAIQAQRFDDPELKTGKIQEPDNAFFGGRIYWEVPADLKSAKIVITATKNHQMGSFFRSSVLDYHNKKQTIGVQF